MKLISYCNHCHEFFEECPERWFEKYKGIVEKMVEAGEPSYYLDIFPCWVDNFLKDLEERGMLITSECHNSVIAIYPTCINVVNFDVKEGVEYYHVCNEFGSHEALLIDEKEKEE